MAKKKRQGEPSNGNTDGSSESSEDVRSTFSECAHVNKSVDLAKVKKLLAKNGRLSAECEPCAGAPEAGAAASPMEAAGDFVLEVDDSLWMCLQCGHQACGRYKNQHALHHYNTPRSDSHSLCLNTTKWSVWCYQCDNEINVNGKRKLHECVEYIKKFADGARTVPNNTQNNLKDHKAVIQESKSKLSIISNNSPGMIARGLTNLGNTCFFNSVMQCLGQTPYLLKLLEETADPGQKFKLPGGKVVLDPKTKSTLELDPLEGILDEWKHLTRTLADTIRELQRGCHNTFNPSTFFGCLTQRMPIFGGGDQHDAHELLRHLLEAVREEDLRRYQSVILKHLGLSTKTDPATVEGEKKTIIRYYGSQASELLLPTEQVFRGVLVSTLQCQDCGHTSHTEEFFLDLSLPISEKQRPPILRRKADDSDDHKPSKHQIKKERRAMRKVHKRGHSHGQNAAAAGEAAAKVGADSNGAVPMDHAESNDKSDNSQSDADVEDNIEDSTNSRTSEEAHKAQTESGYNSDKNSPDNVSAEAENAASPAVGMLSASPFTPDSPATSPASSETNIDIGSPACGQNSPSENGNNEEFERPESRLAFVGNKSSDLKADLEKLSIKTDKKKPEGACGGASASDDEPIIGDEKSEDEQMDLDDVDAYSGTISIPYIEEGECSVLSCLNQFTTSELMTGNNKARCDLCSKRSGGPDKKTVFTNSTKQLLILNPPAVLILHLKRFQVYHFRPSKITKSVKFPMLLDIAPFCSKRALQLPTFEPDQKKVMYSLYGVIEHSGSIHGGHYVAFVKVRGQLTEDNYRWHFLPKNHRNMINKSMAAAGGGEARWWYVSDSHAVEADESRVLNASAYLLFYERIF